jgi:hypothetical protein
VPGKNKTHLKADQTAEQLEVARQYAAKNMELKKKLLAFCKEKDLTCKDGASIRRCHLAESSAAVNWCLQTLEWRMKSQNVSTIYWKCNLHKIIPTLDLDEVYRKF